MSLYNALSELSQLLSRTWFRSAYTKFPRKSVVQFSYNSTKYDNIGTTKLGAYSDSVARVPSRKMDLRHTFVLLKQSVFESKSPNLSQLYLVEPLLIRLDQQGLSTNVYMERNS